MINQRKTKRKSYLAQETRTYPEGICSLTYFAKHSKFNWTSERFCKKLGTDSEMKIKSESEKRKCISFSVFLCCWSTWYCKSSLFPFPPHPPHPPQCRLRHYRVQASQQTVLRIQGKQIFKCKPVFISVNFGWMNWFGINPQRRTGIWDRVLTEQRWSLGKK